MKTEFSLNVSKDNFWAIHLSFDKCGGKVRIESGLISAISYFCILCKHYSHAKVLCSYLLHINYYKKPGTVSVLLNDSWVEREKN